MALKTPDQQQAADERRRRAAAAAAGGTLAVGYFATRGDDEDRTPVPVPKRAAVAAEIMAALVAFLAEQRNRSKVWLTERMAPRASADAVARVVAEEDAREAEFARRQSERLIRDMATALALPDKAAREGAVRGLMAREEVYLRQRLEAQAVRAFAAIDRVVLREQSPQGAFWKLDPTVTEHTAGCLLMGGHFWPWAVLDRVHPPRHHGCPCRLVGYGQAIADGLMGAGDVQDIRKAIRRAAHVLMEAAPGALDDLDGLRDLLFEGRMIEIEDTGMEIGALAEADVRAAREGLVIGLEKPEELRELLAPVGLGRDAIGFFAYSASQRTASHPTPLDVVAAHSEFIGAAA